MEIQVGRGIGYISKESRKKEKLAIGTIVIDAIFTPVRRVALKVESMRVGERTDFDRLFLEIETDGTISPKDAFFQASEVLVKHFDLLFQAFEEDKEAPIKEEKKKKPAKKGKKETKTKKHEKKKKRKKA